MIKTKIWLLFFSLLSISISAQEPDIVVIKITEVAEQLYMLEGKGGNIAVLTGEEGVLMIDDQFEDLAPKISETIASLSDNPLTYIVNTHWHGDHTGGNAAFARKGAKIIAHENVRERMSKEQVRPFGRTTPASEEIAWPKMTFSENMNMYFNDTPIHLIHHHRAHTDGDAFVYFPEKNVLHMGDCFFKNRFPFVDVSTGGTPDGMIEAIAAAVMIADEDTVIIPGHGKVSNKEDLSKYYQMLMIMRDRVKAQLAKDTALVDLDVQTLTSGFDTWGDGFISGEKFVHMLYNFYDD